MPTIIWKTQNPAHVRCDEATEPFPWGHTYEEADVEKMKKFDWHLHRQFDSLARHLLSPIGVRVVDMSPLYLRPDAHIFGAKHDCLHYCQPGPLNLFSQLLLQLLYNHEI